MEVLGEQGQRSFNGVMGFEKEWEVRNESNSFKQFCSIICKAEIETQP